MIKQHQYTEYEVEPIGASGPFDRFTTHRMSRAKSIADRLQRQGYFVTITRCIFRRLVSAKRNRFYLKYKDFYYLSDDRKLKRCQIHTLIPDQRLKRDCVIAEEMN